MKRIIFFVLVTAILLSTAPAFAQDKKEGAKEPLQGPVEAVRQQKELLIANINNLRNQELRVAVLQQMLNEEIAKLRNMQAVFCDTYKLDVEKFRLGQYRYDDRQGKFVLIDDKPVKQETK
ncbi:MAG: hypothetical protein PHW54_07300 [Candidatus Omnitrophica bacterium]|nr:hypothetical protein [Candidatus Omnitrophota bacterium]